MYYDLNAHQRPKTLYIHNKLPNIHILIKFLSVFGSRYLFSPTPRSPLSAPSKKGLATDSLEPFYKFLLLVPALKRPGSQLL